MTDAAALSGCPPEAFNRKALIYLPTKSTMQSGPSPSRWQIDLTTKEKWVNPLMGWASTSDSLGTQTMNNLYFPSAEAAIAFCESNGWEYEVQREATAAEVRAQPIVRSTYADNFVWEGDEEENCHWQRRRDMK
eukprot:CAMPEP_0114548700 /NCGR_PEP_ID=MMETSP0114-20121206/5126_1 /TAXON_ID=31324 /ORGANISM="Goniomonas sp, Strain m" /LENGTH=133 /DNA_ID=CAMNT_0001733317 /DNA_START=119 /DNA_END=520 /DNA_ORIENTATION=+